MAQDNTNQKKGQTGTGSQGTQEREEKITGSVGVQNKQGQNINPGSTTSPKGGQGFGSPNQGGQGNQGGQPRSSTGQGSGSNMQNQKPGNMGQGSRPGSQDPQTPRGGVAGQQEKRTNVEDDE